MSFDRLAPHYRWMERVMAGGVLQRSRLRWVDSVPVPERVLVVGEGPGRFLEVAARIWSKAQFCVADASGPMLERAREAWCAAGSGEERVTWCQLSLPEERLPNGGFDLIVTHFFLDCFPASSLARVVRVLAGASNTKAHWLLSDFGMPDGGWRRARSRVILSVMYGFFRCVTQLPARRLTCPDGLLEVEGFHLHSRTVTNWGLVHADWWVR